MKKVLAVVAVIAVVCVAGTALAQPRAREEGRRVPPQMMPGQPGQHHNPQIGDEGCRCGRDIDRRQGNSRMNFGPNGMPGDFGGRGHKDGFGKGFGGMMFAPDMPDEIKAKVVEVAKLRIDLKAALSQKPVDKAKALEVFAKIQKAEQDIEMWKFEKRLEKMEAFRTQKELNRNVPPAPKPEDKPEE